MNRGPVRVALRAKNPEPTIHEIPRDTWERMGRADRDEYLAELANAAVEPEWQIVDPADDLYDTAA